MAESVARPQVRKSEMRNVPTDPTSGRERRSLSYATGLPRDVRVSKLAFFAVGMSILFSPCILGSISDALNWNLPQAYRQTAAYGYWHRRIILTAMSISSTLSLCAFLRIRFSGGRLLGVKVARFAFVLSLIWWLLLLVPLMSGRD